MKKLGFYGGLVLSLVLSGLLGYSIYIGVGLTDVSIPRQLFVVMSLLPLGIWIFYAARTKLYAKPSRIAKVLFSLVACIPVLLFLAWGFLSLWTAGVECSETLGAGLLKGKPVVASGVCRSAMHEYVEWIEFYPEKYDWIGSKASQWRVATLSPADLGIRATDDQSISFDPQPVTIEFDGSEEVTVYFKNGSKRRIKPISD